MDACAGNAGSDGSDAGQMRDSCIAGSTLHGGRLAGINARREVVEEGNVWGKEVEGEREGAVKVA